MTKIIEKIFFNGKWIEAEYTGTYHTQYHNDTSYQYRLSDGRLVWASEGGYVDRIESEEK